MGILLVDKNEIKIEIIIRYILYCIIKKMESVSHETVTLSEYAALQSDYEALEALYEEAIRAKPIQSGPILSGPILSGPILSGPAKLFVDCISEQREKEQAADIWKQSHYKDLCKLESNNVGNVGETFMQKICAQQNIASSIDGTKTKQAVGKESSGDGIIKGKTVEIKLARRGSKNPSFQHELGEHPWLSNYMIFIDVTPDSIYLSIFNNFTEVHYKSGLKCEPYYPTLKVTWRKGEGAFKFTTSENINEELIKKGNCIKILPETTCEEIGDFINRVIQ